MDRPGEAGEDLVDEYPENIQGDPNFNVGGVDRQLPDDLQLEQLRSYIESTYDPESPQYLALLPDRITHAAMLMLGSAVDHTMPGVAYTDNISQKSCELGEIFGESTSWIISLWDGPKVAKEHFFRPEAAALAQLSGCAVLDVDDVGAASRAVDFARANGAETVAVWAFSSGCGYIPDGADKVALTFPTKVVPLDVPTFTQVGTADSIGAKIEGAETYHSTHYIQTPAEARRKVRDLADFFRN
ncbi:alpha/beta hydrolase [Corynebacterium sp. HMSC074A01]|uniref:alpha/beta hydrolase n=1 Tax=Corynebacterium sp. HMSC074A01 TaxID=1715030 RepID=UPI001FEF4CA3|nr:alpha/beta hydrolase [Corynebacterium sp. HMSC074A01]